MLGEKRGLDMYIGEICEGKIFSAGVGVRISTAGSYRLANHSSDVGC